MPLDAGIAARDAPGVGGDASIPGERSTPRRGVWALALAASGLVVARHAWFPPAAWIGASLVMLALAAAARGAGCRGALAASLVLLAGGWYTARIRLPRIDLLEPAAPGASAGVLTVEGTLVESPVVITSEDRWFIDPEPAARFTLAIDRVEGLPDARGRLRVSVPAAGLDLRAGDRARITGLYTPIPPPLNPGEPDARAQAAQDGARGRLRSTSRDLVVRLDAPSAWGRWWAYRQWLRDRAAGTLGVDVPEPSPSRSLLAGLILGERARDDEVRRAFLDAGLAHVLAISGFHLVVMAGVAMFAVRLVADLGRLRPLAVGALVLAYLLVVPSEAPVVRAGVMVLVMLAAEAAGRRYDRLNLLSWIAVVMLAWRPMDLWSLGWQLSFGLTALLLWQGSRMDRRLFGVHVIGARRRGPEWLAYSHDRVRALVSTSLVCWLGAAPLIVFHTGRLTPLAALASILVVPVVVPLMWSAYAALLAGLIAPGLAEPIRGIALALADAAARLVMAIDSASPTLVAPRISTALTVAILGLVLWWIARGRWRDPRGWSAAAALAAWTAVEIARTSRLPSRLLFRVDTIAVGDGTCHLLRSGSHALVWDCGSLSPGAGERAARAIRALGAWRAADAVLTHSNFDHYSGLAHAARALGVRELLIGPSVSRAARVNPDGPMARTLAELDAIGVGVEHVSAGDRLELGHVVVEFVSPPTGAGWPNDNDHSLAAIVRPRDALRPAFLFTGDMQETAIAALRAARPGLAADAMEAPHHGSWREPAAQLVIAIDPAIVAQSTGPSRADDPRWARARLGRTWLTTAADGASWVEFGRDGSIRAGSWIRRR